MIAPRHARILPAAIALGGLVLPAPPAEALCLCSCTASTTGMAFGDYDQTSPTSKDVNATVTLTCTSVVSVLSTADIAISAGGSGDATARRMSSGSKRLFYNIYSDPARTVIWGDGTGGVQAVTVPLNGLLNFSTSATAYGRIPALQNVGVGTYTDTLTITVTY